METTTNRRTTEEQGTCQDDEPLTPQQQAVLRVLAKAEFPLKGRAVATRAGIRYTSHFRELMTELKQMGLVIFHPEEGGYRKGDPDAVAAVLDEPPRDVPPAVLPALLEILIRVLTRATVRLVIEFDPESEADAPAPAPAASEIRPVTPLEEEIIALCRRAEKPLKGHTVASRLGRSFSSHLRETLAEMVRGGRPWLRSRGCRGAGRWPRRGLARLPQPLPRRAARPGAQQFPRAERSR